MKNLKVKKLSKRGNPSPSAPSRSVRASKTRVNPQQINYTHIIRQDRE